MDDSDRYILAIDLGTSGPKTALVSERGQVRGLAFEPVELILEPGGGAEQDPDAWWAAIVKAARRTLAEVPGAQAAVRAVCCSSQWSGTVPIDADGRHLHNAIIWMDSRGAPQIARLHRGWIQVAGYNPRKALRYMRLTGGAPTHSGKDSLAHILWLRDQRPEIYARTHKFLEPKDYLNLRLTGRIAAGFDSITLHWVTDNRDLSRVRYDPKLLAWAGLSPDQLPELKRAVDVLGPLSFEAAEQLGLSTQVQVVMGAPDVQAAALGSGAVADFAAHLYIGTSSWLTCHVPFKKTDVAHNMASLPSAIPDRYFVANDQEVAGKAIDFLLSNILFPEDGLGSGPMPGDVHARLEQLVAGTGAGSGKLIFAPWLYGERTPVEDHLLRGAWFNLSLSTTRGQLARSVMEGVAYNARWLLVYLEKFIDRRLEAIHMIGGGARSPAWCQIVADVLDRPVRQVAEPLLANLRGAGLLGAVGLGWTSFDRLDELVEIERTFEPTPAHRALYDELFAAFLQIYRRNRSLFARLNRR